MATLGPAYGHAQEYEWVDQQGTVNRSFTLPEAGSFRELRVIDGRESMSALERRTLEIVNQEARASLPALMPDASGEWAAAGDIAPQLASIAATLPENVRDPCLLSWDPQCHEKHARDYDPRLGYAPSLLRGDTTQAAQGPGVYAR